MIGNQKPEFIEKRRAELEKYLQNAFDFLKTTMPREFVDFLHFDEYEAIFLLQKMAHQFSTHIDQIAETKRYAFSILEVHAISRRLGLPCHPLELTKNLYNFSHVLDFCTHLESVVVVPTKYSKMDALQCEDLESFGDISGNTQTPIGTSNIIPMHLIFNVNAFRNLKSLTLLGVSPDNFASLDCLRPTLEVFRVYYSKVTSMSDILLCDDIHKTYRPQNLSLKSFRMLREVHFCNANLERIDDSVALIPNTETLVLNGNAIESIENLQTMTQLMSLSLKENRIAQCLDWHVKLGNIVSLNLSQNMIESLHGLRKLFSLVQLDLSGNKISEMTEVDYLAKLPNLESLLLAGNPLAGDVDYRVRVLSRFKDKIAEFQLDNEKPGQREIDTASILAALRQSKEITNDLRIPTDLSFSP